MCLYACYSITTLMVIYPTRKCPIKRKKLASTPGLHASALVSTLTHIIITQMHTYALPAHTHTSSSSHACILVHTPFTRTYTCTHVVFYSRTDSQFVSVMFSDNPVFLSKKKEKTDTYASYMHQHCIHHCQHHPFIMSA